REDAPFSMKAAGLEVTRVAVPPPPTSFDLVVSVSRDGEAVSLEFNADLFERETIRRLWAQCGQVLQTIVERPETRVADAVVPTLAELEQLRLWNATTVKREELPVHAYFERVARDSPNAIAAVLDRQSITYGDLDKRAAALASRLLAAGTQHDAPVGLCVDRSFTMLAGLLG